MSVIKAIFFARFHHAKGPTVLHQVPEGAVVTSQGDNTNGSEPLFDFSTISGLVIPSQEFCDKLITVCVNHCRIISYPVCVESAKYHRNEFIFNFALVLDEDEDFSGYTTIVRKLAHLFRNLEEQTNFLSKEEDIKAQAFELPPTLDLADPSPNFLSRQPHLTGGKIYALCEMMFEDLNHYCECMIPIDSSNTINLKVFPTRPPPAPIYPWHVPLATVQLSTLSASSSDLTLHRIIPFIDGVRSVAQIAHLADTDPRLTRSAVAHLLYYQCILLLDIFQFSATYAPTAEISSFVLDTAAQAEAIRYIAVGRYRRLTPAETHHAVSEQWAWKSDETSLDGARLVSLYASLRQGVPLRNWCVEHVSLLMGIDVRRFITFGVIKGFLYRVHKYAVLDGPRGAGGEEVLLVRGVDEAAAIEQHERIESWRDSGGANVEGGSGGRGANGNVGQGSRRASIAASSSSVTKALPLARYLDGMHCFDEICTELQAGEREVSERMKAIYKKVLFISR